VRVTRRDFLKLLLIGGAGAYITGDLTFHGPLYSLLEGISGYKGIRKQENVSATTAPNVTTTKPTEWDMFRSFVEEHPMLAKGFDYQNYRSALKYFEAIPELKGEEDLHEFLNAHIRQWDLVLYSPSISIPAIVNHGGLISNDDTSFDNLRIKDLKHQSTQYQ
jgi:hypothetical protein